MEKHEVPEIRPRRFSGSNSEPRFRSRGSDLTMKIVDYRPRRLSSGPHDNPKTVIHRLKEARKRNDPLSNANVFVVGEDFIRCVDAVSLATVCDIPTSRRARSRVAKVDDFTIAVNESATITTIDVTMTYNWQPKVKISRECRWNSGLGFDVIPSSEVEGSSRIVGEDSVNYHTCIMSVWDVQSGEKRFSFGGPKNLNCVRSVPEWNHRLFATGEFCGSHSSPLDNEIYAFDLKKGAIPLPRMAGHVKKITSLDVDVPGGLLCSTSQDGMARLWSEKTSECIETLAFGVKPLTCLFAADLHLVLVGLDSGRVACCDLRKFAVQTVGRFDSHTPFVRDICRTERKMFVSCGHGGIWRWNSELRRINQVSFPGYHEGVCAVGTQYDRPPSRSAVDPELDFAQRCAFVGLLSEAHLWVLSLVVRMPNRIITSARLWLED